MECVERSAWIERLEAELSRVKALTTQHVEVYSSNPGRTAPLDPVQEAIVCYKASGQRKASQFTLRIGEAVPDVFNKRGAVIGACVRCWQCMWEHHPTVIDKIVLSPNARAWVKFRCSHDPAEIWNKVDGLASVGASPCPDGGTEDAAGLKPAT